jgi:hypothetical protein
MRRVQVNDGEVLKGIRYLSTPRHSIDHASGFCGAPSERNAVSFSSHFPFTSVASITKTN